MTVRAYTPNKGGFKLVAATGEKLDGYAQVSFVKLDPPVPSEFRLLLSGQMTGANGPNNRMRLYAYDGSKFRTVWAPANAWGAFNILVTKQGFTIDGRYYNQDKRRHETYLVATDGLYLVFPPKW